MMYNDFIVHSLVHITVRDNGTEAGAFPSVRMEDRTQREMESCTLMFTGVESLRRLRDQLSDYLEAVEEADIDVERRREIGLESEAVAA